MGSLSGPEALEMLRELSTCVHQRLQVKMSGLTISTEDISLSSETRSFDGID